MSSSTRLRRSSPPIPFGVFRHGILDPRLAIRRTTVYGALGVLFIVLFAVVESLVSEILEARLGLPTMLGAALAGATVALIVIPLRGKFSRWMDRWMPAPEKAAVMSRHQHSLSTWACVRGTSMASAESSRKLAPIVSAFAASIPAATWSPRASPSDSRPLRHPHGP